MTGWCGLEVREVHDMVHLVSLVLQVTPEQIGEDELPGLAHMNEAAQGGTAAIQGHAVFMERDKGLFLAGQGIV